MSAASEEASTHLLRKTFILLLRCSLHAVLPREGSSVANVVHIEVTPADKTYIYDP